MHQQSIIIVASLLLLLTSSTRLPADEPTPVPRRAIESTANEQTIEERLNLLETQIHLIRKQLGSSRKLLETGLYTSKTENSAAIEPTAIQDRLLRLERETGQSNDQLDQIQRQLENLDKSKPQPIVPVSIQTATQGRLVVQNWTAMPQYLSVNKVQYYVPQGRTNILVPLQNVEAYLPLYELPKLLGMSMWHWTSGGYEMVLNINN